MINQVTTYLEMIGKNWIQILAPLLDDNPSSQNECSSGFARFKSQLSQTTSDSLAHAGTTCFSVSKDSIKIFSRVRCWLTSLTRRSGGGGKSMLEVQISTLRIGRTLFFLEVSLFYKIDIASVFKRGMRASQWSQSLRTAAEEGSLDQKRKGLNCY